jgi:restriction endonuclease S subunit
MSYQRKVGEMISKAQVKKCGNRIYPILSMTMHQGLVLQDKRFKKQIASLDKTNYKVVKKHQLVESFPIDEGVIAVQEIIDFGIVSPAYKIWNVNTDIVLPKFLEMALRSPKSINYYKEKLRGSTARRRTIPDEILCEMKINCPPIEDQKSIVKIIYKVKNLIQLQKNITSFLESLAKSRFIEIFGDPVLNTKKLKIVHLSEIAEYFNGLTYKPTDVNSNGTLVLRSSNIQHSRLDFTNVVHVGCSIKDRLYVKNNDILMCSRNGSAKLVGKVALIKNLQEPMTFGAFMMIIRSIYADYLLMYFQMDAFRRQIITGATTTINQITGTMLDKIVLPVPDKQSLEKYITFIQENDKLKLFPR